MDWSLCSDGLVVVQSESWMWEQPVLDAEEQLLSPSAAAKRIREFRAGRHCARQALQQLGVEDFALLRDEHGAPLWPDGLCGSISHSGERCLAIAAKQSVYRSVGVDVERDRLIKDDTLQRIAHESEIEQLARVPDAYRNVNVRALLFGMKECVHKVYFPLNRHTLDFLDVAVNVGWADQTFTVQIQKPAPCPKLPLTELQGRFACEDGYVCSVIALPGC